MTSNALHPLARVLGLSAVATALATGAMTEAAPATRPESDAAAAARAPSRAAVEIAAQERAFARMCVAKGMRSSFAQYFAPDAIDFEPQPAPAAGSLPKNPDGAASFTLDWEPWIADASAAGDLGWDTGPYVITDRSGKKDPRHGWFLSVWRRQPDGRWKVAMDVGTSTRDSSGPLRPVALAAFPVIGSRPPRLPSASNADRETAALLDRDRRSAKVSGDALWLPEARRHRDGEMPGVRLAGAAPSPALVTAPSGAGVSRSGDLGYSYGSYSLASGEKGHYARVWKMTDGGDWKIAAQIEKPLPPEEK